MQEIQVFFDYACPYCLRGFAFLNEIISKMAEERMESKADRAATTFVLRTGQDSGMDLAVTTSVLHIACEADEASVQSTEDIIRIVFIPCEAHSRAERPGGLHTDLCARGMYAAASLEVAQGVKIDIWAYHRAIYKAAINDRLNINDPQVVAQAAEAAFMATPLDAKLNTARNTFDRSAFIKALADPALAAQIDANNNLAYNQSGVWAVPAFRKSGAKLDSEEGTNLPFNTLNAFIRGQQ